jgi:hypothetical protein
VNAEGTTSDCAHSIVEPLDGAVGEPEIDGEDAFAVFPYGACNAEEGTEPRAARPAEPFLQSLLGACHLLVAEPVSESLIEAVGAVERGIRSLDLADLGLVFGSQVPLAAKKGEARALDHSLAPGRARREPAHCTSSAAEGGGGGEVVTQTWLRAQRC